MHVCMEDVIEARLFKGTEIGQHGGKVVSYGVEVTN